VEISSSHATPAPHAGSRGKRPAWQVPQSLERRAQIQPAGLRIVELSTEPTLGQLRRSLEIPVAQLLEKSANSVSIKEAKEGRRAVLEKPADIERSLRDPLALGPDVPDHRMDGTKVSTDSSPDVDPLLENVTELLERVAEQTPCEIAHYLARTGAGSSSATVWSWPGRPGLPELRFGGQGDAHPRRGLVAELYP
jgi:hypothetical protein